MRKFVSVIMLLCFTTSIMLSFTGCSKKHFKPGSDPKYVEDNGEPWYEGDIKALPLTFDPNDINIQDSYFEYACQKEDSFFVLGNVYDSEFNQSCDLLEYNMEGDLLSSKDLFELCFGDYDKNGSFNSNVVTDTRSGVVLVMMDEYSEFTSKTSYAIYDLMSATAYELEEFDGQDLSYANAVHFVDKDNFYIVWTDYGIGKQLLVEYHDMKPAKVEDLGEIIGLDPDTFDVFCEFSDDYLFVTSFNNDNAVSMADGSKALKDESCLYKFDLKTQEVFKTNYEDEDYISMFDDFMSYGDERIIWKDSLLVSEDAAGNEKVYCDLDNTNINPNLLYHNTAVVNVSDDSITVFTQTDFSSNDRYVQQPYLLTITKYDKNPYVGRELVYVDAVSDMMNINLSWLFSALDDFNANNDKYLFLMQYDDVDFSGQDYNSVENESDFIKNQYNYSVFMEGVLENKLTTDNGPDIVFGVTSDSSLLYGDYFEDLSDVVKDDYGNNVFLGNVIEASKINGKLYYMPLAFDVVGLPVKEPGKSGNGLTYAEYLMSVFKEFGGVDPLIIGRIRPSYFLELYNVECSGFKDENGYINADDPKFKAMAEYCKNNVEDYTFPQNFYSEEQFNIFNESTKLSHHITCFEEYLDKTNYGQDTVKQIVGYPSYSGIGVSIDITASFAISKKSGSKEACWEFIKYLIEKENDIDYVGQSYLNQSIPVKIDTIREQCREFIDGFNSDDKQKYSVYTNLKKCDKIEENAIDEYLIFLSDCNNVMYKDPYTDSIIFEDINAYVNDEMEYDDLVNDINIRCKETIDSHKD